MPASAADSIAARQVPLKLERRSSAPLGPVHKAVGGDASELIQVRPHIRDQERREPQDSSACLGLWRARDKRAVGQLDHRQLDRDRAHGQVNVASAQRG